MRVPEGVSVPVADGDSGRDAVGVRDALAEPKSDAEPEPVPRAHANL